MTTGLDLNLDLGLDGPRHRHRILVAMSGGVDSSVAAGLMVEAGYQTVGVTLQLYDHGRALDKTTKTCCAGQDVQDARRVAERLGIAHYVLDYEARFRQQVIEDFAESYAAGETPIPCVRCNQTVKFSDLLTAAQELGAACLVTGHYVRRIMGAGGPELHRAVEEARDQSYFLFATTAGQLAYLRFPLGGLTKAQTRAIAARQGLAVQDKPDSQDICFVPTGHYGDLVARLRPGAGAAGEIVDQAGRVIGQHDGIAHYTVGQRRGLRIAAAEPLYVIALDAGRNRVIAGPRAALARDWVGLRDIHWLDGPLSRAQGRKLMVKLRSAQAPVAAQLTLDAAGMAALLLEAPQTGIAHGQAAVFYQGSRVLGGGWIAKTALMASETSGTIDSPAVAAL